MNEADYNLEFPIQEFTVLDPDFVGTSVLLATMADDLLDELLPFFTEGALEALEASLAHVLSCEGIEFRTEFGTDELRVHILSCPGLAREGLEAEPFCSACLCINGRIAQRTGFHMDVELQDGHCVQTFRFEP